MRFSRTSTSSPHAGCAGAAGRFQRFRYRFARAAGTDPGGFSLLELLVGSFLSLVIVGGMLLIVDRLGEAHRDQQQLIDAQMTARLAVEQMQRDIQLAGIGLSGLLPPLHVIERLDDGGIEIYHNASGLTARLVADMGAPGATLAVQSAAGFAPGMGVIVYDGTGAFDRKALAAVSSGALDPDGTLAKAYRVADGTVIKRVQSIRYRLQTVDGVVSLQRQHDGDPPQTVARNVRSMRLTYLDDSVPAQAFIPTSVADHLRISAVEIELEVGSEDEHLGKHQQQVVTVRARSVPRSGILGR